MRVAIVGGTGAEGRALAQRWGALGHDVRLGSRDPERGRQVAAAIGRGCSGWGYAEALEGAEVVVLTVPYAGHAPTLSTLRPLLAGRPLLDTTVPLDPPRVRAVRQPWRCAALEAQALLGDAARVVAGLHHVSAVELAEGAGEASDVLICGDDAPAKQLVAGLIGQLGYRVLDAGALANALALESLTPVLLHLNKRYGTRTGVRITGLDDLGR